MSEQQKAEIEKIIRELIATYGNQFILSENNIYYKINGKIYNEQIIYSDYCEPVPIPLLEYRHPCILQGLILKMKQLASLNPEFVLYVDFHEIITPDHRLDEYCVEFGILLYSLAEQFLPGQLPPKLYYKNLFNYVIDADPMTQVLDYATVKLGTRRSDHLYVCPKIYFIEQEHSDLSYLSMGSAKRGVIAYCMTFDDYKYKLVSGQLYSLNRRLKLLWKRVNKKLDKYENWLKSLPKEERKKYCNVYTIKDLISKEIEKADRLMKRYGIVRVTIPLD